MNTEQKKIHKKYQSAGECPITSLVDVIGGKWKPIIIWVLLKDTKRFGELHKTISGISLKVLSRQLKELEEDGIVTKTIFAEVPPRVEYFLTTKGKSLHDIMHAMAGWSNENLYEERPKLL